MAAGRSFADYVKRKCYNGLFSAAEEYIRENADSMDLRTSHVLISTIPVCCFGRLRKWRVCRLVGKQHFTKAIISYPQQVLL